MKTSQVSTLSIINATRESRVNLQSQLVEAQKEANTGRLADVGLTLGYLTQRTVSLRQDIGRYETFKDSNSVAASRLAMTQTTLDGIGSSLDGFLSTLQAARASRQASNTAILDAKNKLSTFQADMNASVNGAYIFAGVNTDVKPMGQYFDAPPSAAQTALQDAFLAEFGIPMSDPGVANISGADMRAFLDGAFTDLFSGANWNTTWSAASDQNITSRISTNERVETSANANADPFRGIAAVYTMISDMNIEALGDEAYQVLMDKALEVQGQATSDLTKLRAGLGTSEERIKAANDRADIQISLLTGHVGDLERVDPYEATVRVNSLLVQIESAYALTARLQNLSLLNHI